MSDLIQQIASDLQKQIEQFEPKGGVREIGTGLEVGKYFVRVQGLANVKARELSSLKMGSWAWRLTWRSTTKELL